MNNLDKLKTQLEFYSTLKDSIESSEAKQFLAVINSRYDAYKPSALTMNLLAEKYKLDPNCRVVIWGGNWCSDTHEGIPELLKVLDGLHFSPVNMEYHRVSKNKMKVDGYELKEGFGAVPRVTFYRGEMELGSVIEFPKKSWEADMLAFLER